MDDANVTNKLQTTKRFCNFFVAANHFLQLRHKKGRDFDCSAVMYLL